MRGCSVGHAGFADEEGQDVGLEVVDLDEGNTQGQGEGLGEGGAHEKGTEQSWPPGEGHSRNLASGNSGASQGHIHHGNDVLLMGTAGQLGHHTSICLVHLLSGHYI